jgi:hypothetical protein
MADFITNIKAGSERDVFLSRETSAGLFKTKDGIYDYPVLTRTTGDTVKGSTESKESNELRHGRTKSAPQQGNSSSDGALNFEYSPITFDDLMEGAFRNTWKRWTSDTASAINTEGTAYTTGYFGTKCTVAKTFGAKKLLNTDDSGTGDSLGLITVPSGCIVHELTAGTSSIKYMLQKKFGGADNEDIYQMFEHMAVDTFSIDANVGEIITGSFGLKGTTDPGIKTTSELKTLLGGSATTKFSDGITTGNSYVENLPTSATSTQQFTAKKGALYVNGTQVRFSEEVTTELNNSLSTKYALFEANAISTTPLALDITGNLKIWVTYDGTEEIFNESVNNNNVEMLFWLESVTSSDCFYMFQIFNSKLTTHELTTQSKDELDITIPYSSFEEKAMRVFRIAIPKITNASLITSGTNVTGIELTSNIELTTSDISGLTVSAKIATVEQAITAKVVDSTISSNTYKRIVCTFTTPIAMDSVKVLDVVTTFNSLTYSKSLTINDTTVPSPVTGALATPGNAQVVTTWTDSVSADVDYVKVTVTTGSTTVSTTEIEPGVQTITSTELTNGTLYSIALVAVDTSGNESTTVTVTATPTA